MNSQPANINEPSAVLNPADSSLLIVEMEDSSQDGCQALVALFQGLNANALQRRALKALVKTLTHQQIRELRITAEEVDLRCDIIAELPLELSQVILQYLPLYQAFQARRVSSKWKQILSSPQTVEYLLRHWFPAPAADTALHIPHGLSESSILSLKAEHIDAYRTGHAFTYASRKLNCFPDNSDPRTVADLVAYADGIMAWADTTDSGFVKSLDLRTGQEWSFLPEARTRVNAIAVSSSMIAALGSGRCHVWKFRAGDQYCLRLPSNKGQEIAVSGETLVIVTKLWETTIVEASFCVEVTTWTLKDQRTSSFCVALPPKKRGYTFDFKNMLDNTGESLLLFEGVYIPDHQHDKATHFHYIRTSLNGDVLTQGVLEVPGIQDCHACSDDFVPKEANGQAVIWSFAKRQRECDNFSELMPISYNFREDRLEYRTQEITCLRITKPQLTSPLFYWKHAAYILNSDPDIPVLRVIDLQNSTCSEAEMGFSIKNQKFDLRPYEEYEPNPFLLGDEIFLISVFAHGFGVWCFDANVRIFNEETRL